MRAFTVILAAILLCPSVFAQKELLRPTWMAGKVYKHENVTETDATLPGGGGSQKSTMTQEFLTRVTAEPGTGHKLAEMTFAAVKATVKMGDQSISYDSADPAKSPPFFQQTFGAIVGRSFVLVYDKNDAYLEARGLEKLAATPLGGTTAMDGKQLSEAMRKSQEAGLPKSPVAPGDTWTYDEKIELPPMGAIAIKVKGTYNSNLVKDGRKLARLLLQGTFEAPPGNAEMKIESGSKFTGEVHFDLERRTVTSQEVRLELKMGIQGQQVPLMQSVAMKLVSVEDAK